MNTHTPIFLLSLSLCISSAACLSFPEAGSVVDASSDDGAVIDGARSPDSQDLDASSAECAVFDAGCLEGNTVVAGGEGATLVNGNVSLEFDEVNGYLITSLILRDDSDVANLIHNSGTVNEKFVGVHNWSFGFQWAATPTLQILASGEAVFRFRLDSTHKRLQVRSFYTIFPDGRIHRDEQASVNSLAGEQLGAALAAYLALNPAHFSDVDSSYGNTTRIPTPFRTNSAANLHNDNDNSEGWACAYHTNRLIGMAHYLANGDLTTTSNRVRITESALDPGPENQLLSLLYEWGNGAQGAQVGTLYSGNFLIAGSADSPADCSYIDQLQNWVFRFPATLVLGNATFQSGGESDDNGDGYYEGGGFWALASTDGTGLTVTVDTQSGALNAPQRAAFRIHGLTLSTGTLPLVTIDDVQQLRGRDFLWQSEIFGESTNEETVHWIYFGKALTDGQQVQISVPTGI